jgi:hypothetical protein
MQKFGDSDVFPPNFNVLAVEILLGLQRGFVVISGLNDFWRLRDVRVTIKIVDAVSRHDGHPLYAGARSRLSATSAYRRSLGR